MYFEDINFLNFPAIRFKRSSMKNLDAFYDVIYQKFKIEEDEGIKWKEECYQALIDNDEARVKELEKKGKITFVGEVVDILLDKLTLSEGLTDEQFEEYRQTILKSRQIEEVSLNKNPHQVVFKTSIGEFKASKLTDIFPVFKEFPNIETRDRHGNCHTAAVLVSTAITDKNHVATGYCYSFGEGAKYLHSWVELDIDGKTFVIDTTRNLLMPKKAYYFVRNIEGPVYKISSETLKSESEIRDCLCEENVWLNKLYLSNRHQAKRVYRTIKQKQEIQNRENEK